jgi:hypothetical protein
VQRSLLEELTSSADDMADIDMDKATELVEARLAPLH